MGRLYFLGFSFWAVVYLLKPIAAFACTPDIASLRGPFGHIDFNVELALTPQDRAKGLMFRESLHRTSGMLFIFDDARPRSFWMRNTLIPLDILFFDAKGRLLNIQAMAQPLDDTALPSAGPALAVLEINGGLSETLGLEAGVELQNPLMPQDQALWPCPAG